MPGGLGGAQRLDHIPRGTGVGHEQHDILFRHQAGRHHLHVAVARRAELVGDARKTGRRCRWPTSMLPPCPRQNTCRALCSRATALSTASGERAFCVPLMAVMKQRTGVLTQGGRVGVRLRRTLVDQCAGSIGLCQCNAHFMVAFKPQRPAEPEHRSLCHLAFPCQG